MKEAFDEFTRKTELRAFLPTPNEENICLRCGRSHEAMEFVYALVLRAIDTFITDSEEFRKFLAARGYSKSTSGSWQDCIPEALSLIALTNAKLARCVHE